MIYCFILLFFILLYIFFDVNYFLRIAFVISWNKLFKKRKKIFEKTTHYGLCLTMDVDMFLRHMNNARYVRELDFARLCYYERTGIIGEIIRMNASQVQGATSIRYRRPIPVFSAYKVTTQLIYWDDKNLFLQHEFISLSDGFVRATVLGKQSITGPKVCVPDIIERLEPGATRPKLTDELRLWLESMEESSLKFKKLREDAKAEESAEVFLSP